jgi:uncharacterized protein (UPF0276 family)
VNLADRRVGQELRRPGLWEILGLASPLWVSLHLGFSAPKVISHGQYGYCTADGPVLSRAETMDAVVRTLQEFRQLAPGLDVLVENLDYTPIELSGAYEWVCEPEFVAEATAASGCGLLLDMGHAKVSAGNLGATFESYLSALPLHAVRQIHLSRPVQRPDGLWVDAHMVPEPEDIAETMALARTLTPPPAITVEAFAAPPTLSRVLRQAREAVPVAVPSRQATGP